jgi:hypothetical protein
VLLAFPHESGRGDSVIVWASYATLSKRFGRKNCGQVKTDLERWEQQGLIRVVEKGTRSRSGRGYATRYDVAPLATVQRSMSIIVATGKSVGWKSNNPAPATKRTEGPQETGAPFFSAHRHLGWRDSMRALLMLVPMIAIACGGDGTSPGPGDGGSGADGSPSDGGSQPTSAITLQNAMAQTIDASTFYVSFVIDNTKASTTPITRVDTISVAWAGNNKLTGLPACMQAPWIATGPRTGAVAINVLSLSNGTDLGWDCGNAPRGSHDPAHLLLPFQGGQVTVEVDGITSDSAPFTATVTTRLQ